MAFDSYIAIEARTTDACDSIYDGWYTNCTQAAKAYNVPLPRLQRRWNASASKNTLASTNKALAAHLRKISHASKENYYFGCDITIT